ncbi:MAG: TA system VapC family ribonuclease toxin [Bradyrhizobium sp.]
MILVDANILLYSCNAAADLHVESRDWLDEKLNGTAQVGLPWPSLLAFLRIATNPRAFRHPLTMTVAWEQVSNWLSAETAWTPEPTSRHAAVFGNFLALPGVYGNLVPDAHLAALAIEHGLTLCSTDGDFARFPGLTWLNPLIG